MASNLSDTSTSPVPRRSSRDTLPNKTLDQESVTRERCVHLGHQRAGYASQITTHYKQVCDSADDPGCPLVVIKDKFSKLMHIFELYTSVHNEYMVHMAKLDPSTIEQASEQYLGIVKVIDEASKKIDSFCINPQDSVSQATSRSSKASSYAKAAARKAGLTAKSQALADLHLKKIEAQRRQMDAELELKHRHQLEKQRQLETEFEFERLELDLEIKAASAEEETFAKFVDNHSTYESTPFQPDREKSKSEGPSQNVPITSSIHTLVQSDKNFDKIYSDAQQRRKQAQLELEQLERELDATIIHAVSGDKEILVKPVDGGDVSRTKVLNASARIETPVEYEVEDFYVPESGGPSQEPLSQFASMLSDMLSKKEADIEMERRRLELDKSHWEAEMIALRDKFKDVRHVVPEEIAKSTKGVMNGDTACLRPPVVEEKPLLPEPLNPLAHEWSPVHIPVEEPANFSNSEVNLQRQLIDAMRLPKASLTKFDGDPMQYWTFMSAFDSCVHNTSVNDGDKLNCLLEHCIGNAAKVVRSCALMKAGGYKRARELLKERFGDDFKIANAWIKKIVEGPQVKPNCGEALQDFTDDMRCCLETLRAMKKLQEVDSQDRMVSVLSRLPMYVQSRWRKEAYRTRTQKKRYPNFLEFVQWLETVTGEFNDPVFGSCKSGSSSMRDSRTRTDVPQRNKGSNFNVQATEKPETPKIGSKPRVFKCYICNQDHKVDRCDKFRNFDPKKRLEIIKDKKLCFNCLNFTNHGYQQCRGPSRCNRDGCGLKHSELLHEALVKSEKKVAESKKIEAQSCMCGPRDLQDAKVALPIVPVRVRGKGQSNFITTYALLDTGSNKTFCCKSLLNRCKINGVRTTLSLQTLGSGIDADALEVTLEVTATAVKQSKTTIVQLPRVYAVDRFPELKSSLVSQSDVDRWHHLQGITVANPHDSHVTLLIGQDVPSALMPLEIRRGGEDEPYATRTVLGWTLHGPFGGESTQTAMCNFIQADADKRLEAQVEQFWKIDSGHILASSLPQMSQEDRRVIEIWDKSVCLRDGHYQLDIPFKKNPPNLPNNKYMAEKRLQYLGKKFAKDKELHQKYKDGMADLIEKGFAEIVTDEPTDGLEWYLPHHNVVNPNKPEKFRIVFDCAAEYAGTSLNRQVMQGPDMTNDLIAVLLRFREGRIAVMGDIEAMFHQVKVTPAHRDALRFLWWKNGDTTKTPDVYRMTVHLFGGVWSPSCASFALRRAAEDHNDLHNQETIQTVFKSFYVDDTLRSLDADSQAILLIKDLCDLLAKRGFRLTKWTSNSRKVIESVPVEDRAKEVKALGDSLPAERALGLHWETESDTFGIKIRERDPVFTKRGLLRITSSVYDPLGFVGPFILEAKKIFQLECRMEKSWDDDLSPANVRRWKKWLDDLPKLQEFQVQRCLLPEDFGNIKTAKLMHFGDASEDAYGAVSYLWAMNDDGKVHCSFVMAKTRLAPIKPLTIPRLELSAAVVAVKLDSLLRRELTLPLDESTFWTDSTIVLQYIKNRTKRFHTFVANRVAVILDGSEPSQWQYVDTKNNPADDVSRGMTAQEMVCDKRWTNGPEFLRSGEDSWPQLPTQLSTGLPEEDPEVKRETKTLAVVAMPEDVVDQLLSRYSCWFRLRKAVAWLLRFAKWLKEKPKMDPHLSVKELQLAEIAILRYIQKKNYDPELQRLKAGASLSRKSRIYDLEPTFDSDGLMVVKGRLHGAPIADSAKHPVIVPRDHHVAELIVRDVHERESRHSGREYVLARLRKKFWIPQARPLVKRVLRNCVVCRRLQGKFVDQRMADLPMDRVTPHHPPFTFCGVDCFGPFYVKRGRSHEKRYGCLFTCLTMDSDSFINALIRFCARRGVPMRIRSDNGSNFVGGDKELRQSIANWNKSHKMNKEMLLKDIEWIYNPPAASHMGGSWERQIRTVRKVLNAILRNQVLDDERLDTIFAEVEGIVNSRPLTSVSNDPNDFDPLTPNQLLHLGKGMSSPPGNFGRKDAFRRRWRQVQYLVNQFWEKWIAEYLPTIQLRSKWIIEKRNFKVGDIVLILDDALPRSQWPLGRVTNVRTAKDGLVRSVELKTSRSAEMVRPVDKICLLEGFEDSKVDTD